MTIRPLLVILIYVLIAGVVIEIFALAWIHHMATMPTKPTVPSLLPTKTMMVGETDVAIEIAQTPTQQDLGLGNRLSLPHNHGMLFPFPQAVVPNFWMYRMHLPLDFIWIADGKVVDLTQNVPAPSDPSSKDIPTYSPKVPVDAVLEVNVGFVSAHHIQIGGSVTLPSLP